MAEMNEEMKEYFDGISKEVREMSAFVDSARKKGLDAVDGVEIPIARNMAERVEGLISVVAPQIRGCGMVERIQELEGEFGKLDWRVALNIAEEIANEKFCKFKDKHEAMEIGIRVGIAYVTNGVVASPLEGFTQLKVRKRKDGGEYVALFFSGPIRSAGGTGASVSVIIGDYIRKKMGYKEYDPEENEVKRIITEMYDYHERVTNLQYLPSADEIEYMVKHVCVQIDGDPSEKYDVSNYKDLPRIETNKLRNGVCLVIGEGLCQKAPKLWKQLGKWGGDMGLEQWGFLEGFLKLQKDIKARAQKGSKDDGVKIKPDYTFIKDIVAGRPVLTHPLRVGGFRLRYGRARNTGLSSMAIHPATMNILDDYIAIGSQIKVERPSKGSALSMCDGIEGPIVKLKDQSVVLLSGFEKAKEYAGQVSEILFLGDLLIPYGDFFNRAHVLVPPGYCEEWWVLELEKGIIERFGGREVEKAAEVLGVDNELINNLFKDFCLNVELGLAEKISREFNVPLHPRWSYHWKDINEKQVKSLVNWLKKGKMFEDKMVVPLVYDVVSDLKEEDPKRVLEVLGVPHLVVAKENVVITGDDYKALLLSLNGLKFDNGELNGENGLEIVNKICGVKIRDKSGLFIGARMGRPEKAKMRKLTGSPQTLFPVGAEGGKMRSFQAALGKGVIKGDFPVYLCECGGESIYPYCIKCGKKTKRGVYCNVCGVMGDGCGKHDVKKYRNYELNIREYFESALKSLKLREYPELIKGVRGTSNEDHTPENLVKGILRAIHGLYVNKDGTIRYDATELVITAFKPCEINVEVDKLKSLGYNKDIYGNELVDKEQVVELKCQDVILPGQVTGEEGSDNVMFRVCRFIDDMLVYFYGEKGYYNLKSKEELVGQLILAIAPHISAGIVCRIIGFSKTQGFYAHPMLHCAVRRDADGDEVAFMMLMDAFMNFSRKYLPAHRGSTQDAPLVLSERLIPSEIDDMAFDVDLCESYGLEFYNACLEYKMPWEVKIEQLKARLGSEKQYTGWRFTHKTSNINNGVLCSAYKSIPSMQEKVFGQIAIAEKIRAVDEADVARLVIERHFIRDIRGNLRKFSTQEFRCVNCNEKYRRPSLMGVCLKCGGRIVFTVAEGSVTKYLEPSLSLAEKFELPAYLRQSLELTKMRIESVFGREKERQEGLGRWFG
ncbi:MAG TPA: DNA polymerase II large subunit [Candidatus Nanoarchaeia archaeon]|nr:DNA polymerase II large subunit [Candidatus Nanoarchaeia archaeon]